MVISALVVFGTVGWYFTYQAYEASKANEEGLKKELALQSKRLQQTLIKVKQLQDDNTPIQQELVQRQTEADSVPTKYKLQFSQVAFQERVATGGFGVVAKAIYNEGEVAVKLITLSGSGAQARLAIKKFWEEIKALSKINHSNIVRLVGFTETPKLGLVLEWAGGGTLYDYYLADSTEQRSARSLLENQTLRSKFMMGHLRQLASALCHLSDLGLIHRDIKLENILLTRNHKQIKVADLGEGKFVGGLVEESKHTVVGFERSKS